MPTTPRERLGRLFEYIAEQARDVDPRSFQLSRHAGLFQREPGELLGLPGLELDLLAEGEPLWLRVPRLEPVAPPAVAERFRRLILVGDDPAGAPPALDEAGFERGLQDIARFARRLAPSDAAEPTPAGRALALAEAVPVDDALGQRIAQAQARFRDAVQEALRDVTARWQAWAAAEAPRRGSIELYGALFALMHQLEAQQTGKPVELVWGLGVASWRLRWEEESFGLRYPLLTQAVQIALDPRTLALELRPRTTAPRLELDAFIACRVPGAAELEQAGREWLSQQVAAPSPFDPAAIAPLLRRIAGSLDPQGRYAEVLAEGGAVPAPGEHLVVSDAWVLFARPQSQSFLIDDLRRLRAQLETLGELPGGPAALVTPPGDEASALAPPRLRGLSSRGEAGPDEAVQELYFPLPYNPEQVTIVERLERSDGVTVQGPPGTGKTHTIANIICHWLATGRRVLVTSRGETALQVLQEKIPAEVRPLTVALLSSDREGLRQFQGAIEAIQHRVSQLEPEGARQRLAATHEAIELAHAELGRIDRRVDDIARAQLSTVDIDGRALRAQQLAEWVQEGRERFGWFDDALDAGTAPASPLSGDEARELAEARRALGAGLAYLQEPPPPAHALPDADTVQALHKALQRLRRVHAELASGALPALQGRLDEARALLAAVEAALETAQALEKAGQDWAQALRRRLGEPGLEVEAQALQALLAELPRLAQARGEFLQRPVDVPDEALGCARTREAVGRAARGGKPFGWLSFGDGEARQRVAAIRVAGQAPATVQDWAHVQCFLAAQAELQALRLRWQRLVPELGLPEVPDEPGALRRLERLALLAGLALRLAQEVDAVLPGRAQALLAHQPLPASGEVGVVTVDALQRLHRQLQRHLALEALEAAPQRQQALLRGLTGGGPLGARWRAFVLRELGHEALDAPAVAHRDAMLRAEALRVQALAPMLERVRDAAQRIEAAGAPRLAQRLRTVPAGDDGDPVLPPDWREAWSWARARAHLASIEAREELRQWTARRAELEQGLRRLYEQLVAQAAWLSTRLNASPKVLSALAGYANAIHRIGHGTGPNAARYRRDAQAAMLDAAPAVPCWIMSHARVSEAMPADIGAFDLVIVDEASQSDLWALPAVARGRKILVVGDHKQVSPEGGFIASTRIDDLRRRFLADQPFAAAMTPEKSLYDLAAQVFAGQQVMLREHFRCVAPIIEYANRNFYEHAVLPLRVPRAGERIEPPLVDLFVEDGVRDARDRNDAEAQAIADEIGAILADEKLAGRTLGVVSLLGLEQARHVDAVVRARFDAAELLRRHFTCGDARTFQGSERDIMFLSLVVDARQCKALSGNGAEQRFNVAASRARDRMVLVRSVRLEDLSEKDLRRTLLAHFQNPLPGGEASSEGRPLRSLCESGFEREVFDALAQRGYRVLPQVRAGAYRIDLVVEGAHDARLAIECDGDAFHGPERWQQDVQRQRVLERAGWVFWRCFASTWTLQREAVLGELLSRLGELGIEPVGSEGVAASALVERRTWRRAEVSDGAREVLREVGVEVVSG